MTLIFQFAVFVLIATSSILLIRIPVVFASPDGWSSKFFFYFPYIIMDWVSISGGYP